MTKTKKLASSCSHILLKVILSRIRNEQYYLLHKANSGSSRDWAKGEAKIKYSFTVELPDDGDYGFLLPPEEILDTGKETWEAVKVVAKHIIAEQARKVRNGIR